MDVIIPAYNEQENIARLLRSIDVAAERYGGPVLVVVSNDGSVDRTEQIAQAEIARLRFATGRVLTAPNGGQSAALNRALAVTTSDICVRIDADSVMGADALVYSVPWFRDPEIGMVGAMEEPRTGHGDLVPPHAHARGAVPVPVRPAGTERGRRRGGHSRARSRCSGGRPLPRPAGSRSG